jgi:hypothetical protein
LLPFTWRSVRNEAREIFFRYAIRITSLFSVFSSLPPGEGGACFLKEVVIPPSHISPKQSNNLLRRYEISVIYTSTVVLYPKDIIPKLWIAV